MGTEPLKPNEYRCAECLEVYEKSWTDEEAAAEATANGFDGMDCVVVCDDCYHAAMKRMGHIPV